MLGDQGWGDDSGSVGFHAEHTHPRKKPPQNLVTKEIDPGQLTQPAGIMGSVEASATTTTAPATPPEGQPDPPEVGSVPPEDPQPDPAEGEPGDRDETGRYLSKEAATYRRRLRDTEAERDQLREQLDRLQTAEAERLASGAGLAVATDLWQFGGSLESLRRDDGTIDGEMVSGLVGDIVKARPGLKAPVIGSVGIGRGNSAGGRQLPKVGLSQLLKP